MAYVPRVAPSMDRRRKTPPTSIEWTATLAYAVGLLATDGCQTDGRHLAFPSADRELVETLLRCLGKANRISEIRSRNGNVYYKTQIGDVAFCRWLAGIGIGPRKSRTIGGIDVPDCHLVPLMRGLLDGDGSIINKVARADTKRRDDYYWEYLRTQFVSASRAHLEWVRGRALDVLGLDGYIALQRGRDGRHDRYTLRFGKRASLVLLPLLYADRDAPCLTRKWRVWNTHRSTHRLPSRC